MTDYRDKIKQFMEAKNIKPSFFVENMGFSNGLINKLIKKEIHIGVDKLENILNFFPDLNPTWLFSHTPTHSYMVEEPKASYTPQDNSIQKELLNRIEELAGEKAILKKELLELKEQIKQKEPKQDFRMDLDISK